MNQSNHVIKPSGTHANKTKCQKIPKLTGTLHLPSKIKQKKTIKTL